MGTDESSSEASLHKKTLVIEEKAPHTDPVASSNLTGGELGKEDVPHDWLKEEVSSDLDEVEHIKLN